MVVVKVAEQNIIIVISSDYNITTYNINKVKLSKVRYSYKGGRGTCLVA